MICFYTQELPSDVRMHNPGTLSQAMELAAQAGEAAHGGSGNIPPQPSPTPSPAVPAATPMELGAMRTGYSTGSKLSGSPMVCFFCDQHGHSFRHCRLLAQLKRELAAKRGAGLAP